MFNFNASLGATIEEQVVVVLNALRDTWDPKGEYPTYRFVRQPQTFPDVVLKTTAPGVEPPVLMGVELKGWYVLAKEREPSFRYKASPLACHPCDLLAVYPWALSEVVSGTPKLLDPFVIGARAAAEQRNENWRRLEHRGEITPPVLDGRTFYLPRGRRVSDTATNDAGGNFGRPRGNIENFDVFLERVFGERLSGVPLGAWQRFLAAVESEWNEEAAGRLDQAIAGVIRGPLQFPREAAEGVTAELRRFADLLAQTQAQAPQQRRRRR